MKFEVKQATIDDWDSIKLLHSFYKDSKAVKFIHSDLGTLQAYLVNSIVNPSIYGLLLLYQNGVLCGMAALQLVVNFNPAVIGAPPVKHVFIHTVYIAPKILGAHISSEAGKFLDQKIIEWGKQREAGWLFANVRTEKRNVGLMKKYGYAPIHLVIGKEVKDG